MRDLGLEITIDGIGNVVGVMDGEGDGPPVMTGSHIDTVRTGAAAMTATLACLPDSK